MNREHAMPDTTPTIPSPNDLLAVEITEALATAGLVKDNHKGELLAKLKSGGVSQDDWGLWIDLATAPQDEPGEAGNE